VHVGSLGTLLMPGATAVREIVAAARAAGALVSYDPNVRRALVDEPASYVRDVTAWAASAHVVKASSDDVAFLAEHGDVRWSSPFVAVTHGADGISVATPASWQVRPSREVEVVDTIGAGDSFMAGLLDGLAQVDALDVTKLPRLQGDVVAAVADHAALAAALTCTRAGADPPRREELDAATAADA
jgi:fructokinase